MLLAVVQVGGVPEVAEALGIGEATVKTHLQRLFAKTDTSRQAELVKLWRGSPTLSSADLKDFRPRTAATRIESCDAANSAVSHNQDPSAARLASN